MMKKITSNLCFAFLILAAIGCKKDYECTCIEKDVFQGNVETFEFSYSVKDANRTQAQAACNEATIRLEESANNYYEISCELN